MLAEIHHDTPVLIVGAGPAGMIAAMQLARKGIRCLVIERNLDTTKWPKMDITNCRTMELLRRLGLDNAFRDQGVAQNYSFDVIFSTGLGEGGELISKWDLPSPDAWRERIKAQNDGTMPHQPYQRCSQAIFEAWLKPILQKEPLIESHFGLKFESLEEQDDQVVSQILDVTTGERHIVKSQYVIGCDGAGSRVRRSMGVDMIGGPVPMKMHLVHFKSQDLTRLHRQGQFWHIFFTSGSVIISQDEVDTWTTHQPLALDVDVSDLDPTESVYKALGGSGEPFKIDIDKILVSSTWRPNIAIAEKYRSPQGRIFLAGDSAHQNIPTGGYGMNTGIGDSFDIAWKVAAVLNGYGGEYLLRSYEEERKPVGVRNIERSGTHQSVHFEYQGWVREVGQAVVRKRDEEGAALRERIKNHVSEKDGENKDHGIEMGYRDISAVIIPDPDHEEPCWEPRKYIPSTWPGARPPQLLLKDGKTSIFDLFGPDYTLIDFTGDGILASQFAEVAKRQRTPLKLVHLVAEAHIKSVWGTDAALIRPDDHVAWRATIGTSPIDVDAVLSIATGKRPSNRLSAPDVVSEIREKGFSATIGVVDQSAVEGLGDFQK